MAAPSYLCTIISSRRVVCHTSEPTYRPIRLPTPIFADLAFGEEEYPGAPRKMNASCLHFLFHSANVSEQSCFTDTTLCRRDKLAQLAYRLSAAEATLSPSLQTYRASTESRLR